MREPLTQVDDVWARAIGIPTFGIGIPWLFDLYGPVAFGTPMFFFGQAMFLGLAFAIWQGNRHLLFTTADRFDWLDAPSRRVGRLILGIVLFTAPLTVAVLAAWFHVGRGEPIDLGALRGVVLMNVICVVFVTHVYETVLLVKARQTDLLRVAHAERARAESELLALRRQIDPHFLFNCLNTQQALIQQDPARALQFNQSLAAMLRYLLETSAKELVPLEGELSFVERYAELMKLRFGEAFELTIEGRSGQAPSPALLPPTSVQLLVENAVAHNRLSVREPLTISLELNETEVVVSHPHRARPDSKGAGVGLANLRERLRLAGDARLSVSEEGGRFTVRVPLLSAVS